MMISQFKRGTGGPGLGFAAKDGSENFYGKIRDSSGLKPSEKPTTGPKFIKVTPPKPNPPTVKDGVFVEPPKAPPQK